MSYTVSQLLVAARRNPELLTGETAAYMVLSLAEQLLSGARSVRPQHVLLHPGGAITLGTVEPCSSFDGDAGLRALLRELLECSVPATVSEALLDVAQSSGEGPAAVRAELQTALVPLNRGAARRALARLHRKVGQLSAEVCSDDEVEVVVEAPIKRRGKRRGATSHTEDIPIAVDETAFRVASRIEAGAASSKPVDVPRGEYEAESARVSWHPAQVTPWQFRDAALGGRDGTPILGTVLVRERDLEAADGRELDDPTTNAVVAPNAEVSRAASENRRHQLEQGLEGQWDDTFVDAEVSVAGDPTVAAPTFNPRRSRVSDLVQRIGTGPSDIEQARKSLLELVNASADEHEFVAPGTVTPPPVEQDARYVPPPPPRRGKRRIVLSALAAGVASFCAWMTFTRGDVDGATPTVVVASTPCRVDVHVEVPSAAKVFLNDAQEREAQSGPIAMFEGVSCVGQAEVTVRVPSPDGSPLPNAWVRMPLPEVELRSAFESGKPLVVAPLGDR